MKKIRLFEMFAGFGGASFALKKAGIDFETVGYSEIDKFAIQCYEQNHCNMVYPIYGNPHNTVWFKNYGDATKINPHDIPDFDLLTGGFPCQAFSVAGKGLGELDTRGTLFNEIIRITEVKQPKYILLENVKGLTNKRHKATFDKILYELDRIGYRIYYIILNSKDYGVPQNRERIWFVCFRNDLDDEFWDFQWPEKEELKLLLKDILEKNVDEKYYLKENHLKRLLTSSDLDKKFSSIDADVGLTMTARQYANWKGNYVAGNVNPSGRGMNGNVYGGDVSPTITTNKGEGYKIYIKNATKQGYQEAMPGDGVNLEQPDSTTRRGRVQPQSIGYLQTNDQRGVVIPVLTPDRLEKRQNGRRFKTDGEPAFTVTAQDRHGIYDGLTIRKLTPTECFRLMGFLDDGINLDGLSDTQKYKLAGNGWDVNLVSKIFKQMFK